jgi:uncharacterized circularly permuted ATP-grasp superfamily protein
MMTPGPYNETYFEHAFKARYLGFPLVEGADLTVRDRRVHLKTLEGLRRVDVIARRVDEAFCDPLELNADTWLGVPGLVEAWRSGNVALGNGLGTGAVETPALFPFLPGICRHLMGEELKLPCAPYLVVRSAARDGDGAGLAGALGAEAGLRGGRARPDFLG